MVLCERALSETLRITEIFDSIQGESTLSGCPTTFVRLSGCLLRCSWCDTSYAWEQGEEVSIAQVLSRVDSLGHPFVCITGGEPLLQSQVHHLMELLCDTISPHGREGRGKVSLETGGSLPIDEVDPRVKIILDVKCPNSGMCHKNRPENWSLLRPNDEVKYVIQDRKDYEWAREHLREHELAERCSALLFSPVLNSLDPKELVNWILADRLPVRLQLQLHKFIWPPHTRGV